MKICNFPGDVTNISVYTTSLTPTHALKRSPTPKQAHTIPKKNSAKHALDAFSLDYNFDLILIIMTGFSAFGVNARHQRRGY